MSEDQKLDEVVGYVRRELGKPGATRLPSIDKIAMGTHTNAKTVTKMLRKAYHKGLLLKRFLVDLGVGEGLEGYPEQVGADGPQKKPRIKAETIDGRGVKINIELEELGPCACGVKVSRLYLEDYANSEPRHYHPEPVCEDFKRFGSDGKAFETWLMTRVL